ncbi:hypothetical protein IMZ31_19175 (plasmid) [Pontibacillus sp. ALD_SL1]|uniref:hypothetical protein n=1 Tax=Pontibacillus sp. ALD_SL1 TaxID=2777185 RepID=UPI001A957A07|nr:hypothetical protein [Pontibacillus sp. ALD_SL1]QST02673.1 hypothetical protein IMZ31_19175 [Pontibacillus sp. ALD_SL1]
MIVELMFAVTLLLLFGPSFYWAFSNGKKNKKIRESLKSKMNGSSLTPLLLPILDSDGSSWEKRDNGFHASLRGVEWVYMPWYKKLCLFEEGESIVTISCRKEGSEAVVKADRLDLSPLPHAFLLAIFNHIEEVLGEKERLEEERKKVEQQTEKKEILEKFRRFAQAFPNVTTATPFGFTMHDEKGLTAVIVTRNNEPLFESFIANGTVGSQWHDIEFQEACSEFEEKVRMYLQNIHKKSEKNVNVV